MEACSLFRCTAKSRKYNQHSFESRTSIVRGPGTAENLSWNSDSASGPGFSKVMQRLEAAHETPGGLSSSREEKILKKLVKI